MIRQCDDTAFKTMYSIINDAATAYRGVIPGDRWKEPYMSEAELRREIQDGVDFWGYEEGGNILGIMGIQHVQDVTLIRHAYVRTECQRRGIGGELLAFLYSRTARPVLIGTWAAAAWAVAFYEKRGFQCVPPDEKTRLLRRYWSVSRRQAETSVVLADARWFARHEAR